jgi:hypothetical protein
MLTRARRIAWMALLGISTVSLAGCIERFFFYPDSARYASPEQFGLRAEDVRMQASDGTQLHGWFLPASGTAKGTVLHLHGNAANVSNHLPLVAWLPARGYNVPMLWPKTTRRSGSTPGLVRRCSNAASASSTMPSSVGLPSDRPKPR